MRTERMGLVQLVLQGQVNEPGDQSRARSSRESPVSSTKAIQQTEFQEMDPAHVQSCLTRQVLLSTIQEPKF